MSVTCDGDKSLPRWREGLVAFRWPDNTSLFLFFTAVGLAGYEWSGGVHDSVLDLGVIIALGLPHGALDVELARVKLTPRLGRWWFPAFGIPYVAIALVVLVAWHAFPLASLALFLVLSTWHFGAEHVRVSWLMIPVLGGAPIALPVLIHPTATAALLSGIMQVPLAACPPWLVIASWLWVVAALAVLCRTRADRWFPEIALIAGLYACLSPLTALAIYFTCVHAPAHVRATVAGKASPRITSLQGSFLCALPATLLTVSIGILLWPVYPGSSSDRLLALTIQGLAALTVPHMLMEHTIDRIKPRNVALNA